MDCKLKWYPNSNKSNLLSLVGLKSNSTFKNSLLVGTI